MTAAGPQKASFGRRQITFPMSAAKRRLFAAMDFQAKIRQLTGPKH